MNETTLRPSFSGARFHFERNLYGYVHKADRGDVVSELKEIRKTKDLPAARQKLNDFIEHWKKRYKRVEKLAELSGLFTFYDFSEAIRSTIYTTNVIESFNKQLKRQIDKKEQFPNENALDRFVMTQIATHNDQNVSRIRRTRTGFTSFKNTLDAMF
ncbi:transposase [Limosilactobacillus mucosae]|uniref:transposase n=1 Tax=Limosilactobacillus mucosae TaxID=97478 RepID=UPI003EBEA12D